MKISILRFGLILLILASVLSISFADQTGKNKDSWKLRYQAKGTGGSKIAKSNPAVGIVISDRETEVPQIYSWDVLTGAIKPVTNAPNGIFDGTISADGKYIFYLQDDKGSEIGHMMMVPITGGKPVDITPGMTPFTLRGTDVSADGKLFALNPVNADGFQIWMIDIRGHGTFGKPRMIYKNKFETWLCLLSHDGKLVAAQSTERASGQRRYSTIVLNTSGGKKIAELWDGPEYSVEPVMFSPVADDNRLLAMTSKSGFRRPLIWNPLTDERKDIYLPDFNGDVMPIDWSKDGKKILLNNLDKAIQHLYIYNVDTDTLTKLNHPSGSFGAYGGEYGGVGYFASGKEIFVNWEDASHLPTTIALDIKTGEKLRDVLKGDAIPEGHPWKSVSFKSSDGQEIQGWLGLPDGEGPFPTLLNMHGGPHVVMTEAFDPSSQAFLDNGFAYMTINYRGSTTFGKDFKEKIWGDVGHWELEDMVAARDYLVKEGIAKPDEIILDGASYGGYLTLWGLSRKPDLWAGGIVYVGIADWIASYEDASDALKGAMGGWFGTTPDKDPERFKKSSPITYAEDIKAPLLIIQGKNDSRTPKRQMENFLEKMNKLGKPVEIYWYDEGHGMSGIDQMIMFTEKALEFAKKLVEKGDKK